MENVKRTLGELVRQIDAALAALNSAEGFYPAHFQFLLILTLLDLMGALTSGHMKGKSSENAVNFVRNYLGKQRPAYREIGGLLYHLLRHGVVHGQIWKSVLLTDGRQVTIRPTRGVARKHLLVESGAPKTPWQDTLWLSVEIPLLWKDTKSAIQTFINIIATDSNRLSASIRELDHLVSAEHEADMKRKPYIVDSDFDYVLNLAGEKR